MTPFSHLTKFVAGSLASIALSTAAFAQFPSQGVSLLSHLDLATFSASSGNDCWGYVSPSGREYAIMGLNNKLAFIEVTNPASPNLITTISHSSSSWGDVKIYGTYAYGVSEAASGIQVINLANIDNGSVTLVRTISAPARTHNIVINPEIPYFYTCGSRGTTGTGTTQCFSLANPSNPVKVGPNSMTTNYQHDGLNVIWQTGTYAGKELWFGCSESRGVDIYDFSNKATPILIKRVVYPDMNYCHQAWISPDQKYLYVDDELDEQGLNVPTRSLIFNIEDPDNAFYVGSYTSGLPAIDHNQYVTDGFTFQANYKSGLRIFDLENPVSPVQSGFFDTYPADDTQGFSGAWSNYPFFPSGNVIISDINQGFFMVDATEATTRNRTLGSFSVPVGLLIGGNLASLANSDDQRVTMQTDLSQELDDYPMHIEVSATSYDNSPLRIQLNVEAKSNLPGFAQSLELYNWNTSSYEQVDYRLISTSDTTATVNVSSNLTRFVNTTTRQIKARARYVPLAVDDLFQIVDVDLFSIRVTR